MKGEKFTRGFNFKIDINRHPMLPVHADYEIEHAGDVAITVHDAEGRHIKTLLHHHQASGKHTIQWDGSTDQAQIIRGGTYAIRLCANGKKAIRKLHFS